jgi:hypothetical protein
MHLPWRRHPEGPRFHQRGEGSGVQQHPSRRNVQPSQTRETLSSKNVAIRKGIPQWFELDRHSEQRLLRPLPEYHFQFFPPSLVDSKQYPLDFG